MRFSVLGNVLSVLLSSVIGTLFAWAFGITLSVGAGAGFAANFLYSLYIAAVAMVVDELVFKAIFRRVQFNWQDVVGCAITLATIVAFMVSACTQSYVQGVVATIIFVFGVPGSFLWWYYPYRYSVMQMKETAEFDRKRAKWLLGWGSQKHVMRVLARFQRYRCVGGVYDKGDDYALPFDDTEGNRCRTLNEMKVDRFFQKLLRKNTQETDTLIAMTERYLADIAKGIVDARPAKDKSSK